MGRHSARIKTLTCIHAVVHLVVTGLSIFTQVARGWGFWESEGRWFSTGSGVDTSAAIPSHVHTTLPAAGAGGALGL